MLEGESDFRRFGSSLYREILEGGRQIEICEGRRGLSLQRCLVTFLACSIGGLGDLSVSLGRPIIGRIREKSVSGRITLKSHNREA